MAAVMLAFLWMALAAGAADAQISQTADKQEVMIPSGDVMLAATLYRPPGAKGTLPAIVTAHGSAPSDREMMLYFTEVALDMGFAVLTFDKRGVGRSTGTYERFNVGDSPRVFRDLAMDVVHSVRWLATQPGIDASRIGLFGGSQAGWIMPLAASEEPSVRFILSLSGVSITWPQVYAADQLALQYTGDPGYDPAPVLERITTPTLWIWGLYDRALPTIPSIDRVGQLIKAGKTNNDVHILPYAGHNPRNVYTGEQYDLTPVMMAWLREQGVLEAPAQP